MNRSLPRSAIVHQDVLLENSQAQQTTKAHQANRPQPPGSDGDSVQALKLMHLTEIWPLRRGEANRLDRRPV